MVNHQRMSPFTALFLGIFGTISVGIISGGTVAMYALHIVDSKTSNILDFAEGAVANLPEFIDSLPDAISDILHDRRAPEYASNMDIELNFVMDEKHGKLRPTLNITNNGSEVVSIMAVRVAALNKDQVPIHEWTEVVATPLAIDDDWRGPIMPGATRYVVLSSGWRGISIEDAANIRGVVEISEMRIWEPSPESEVSLTVVD